MASQTKQAVEKQLDKGTPDDGRETIDNRERGCGHLKPNSAYVRTDVAALSAPGGELPRFVELDEPVEYREGSGRGSLIPGFIEFPGNAFSLRYAAEGKTTTPKDDIHDHIDRLQRFGLDGDHYGDIPSARAHDLLMSVGKSNWDTPDDFVSECRERGLNLKIPVSQSQEPPVVDPLRTRVWVIHPHGAGEDRPAIIGYSYLTRTVFTTGTKASADDPDIPKWAENMAKAGKFDVVDRGEPIAEDDPAFDDAQTTLDGAMSPKEGVAEARKALGSDADGVEMKGRGSQYADEEAPADREPDEVDVRSKVEDGSLGVEVEEDPAEAEAEPDPTDDDTVPAEADDDRKKRDVATLTVAEDDAAGDVTGLEVEFDRHDLLNTRRRASLVAANEDGAITYNDLKLVAGRRDDVDVDAQPSKEELIDAIVGAGAFVPAYDDGGSDE